MNSTSLPKDKKSVLITGCSEGGIGASLAITFQQTGRYHVFATARTTSKIPVELSTDTENVTVLALDVTSKESIEKAAQAVSKRTRGRLDVLINNSGFAMFGQPAVDTDVDLAKSMFEVNYFGVMAVTSTFLPLLVMAKGVIVNNSSIAAEKWIMYNANYSATKSALNIYSECVRMEVAALGVRVIILSTGTVLTNVFQNQPSIKISEKSFYAPIESFLKKLPEEAAAAGGMPADEYTRKVLQAIKSGVSGKVFLGTMSWMFKNIAWWLPNWIWDQINLLRSPEQHKLTLAAEKWRADSSA